MLNIEEQLHKLSILRHYMDYFIDCSGERISFEKFLRIYQSFDHGL